MRQVSQSFFTETHKLISFAGRLYFLDSAMRNERKDDNRDRIIEFVIFATRYR